MAAPSVAFIGIRTPDLEATIAVFRLVTGTDPVREERDLAGFRLVDGTVLELYDESEAFHSFFTTGPVVGFRVPSFDETKARLGRAGLRFIGAPQHADGTTWQHFELPDGTIAEIIGPGQAPTD